MTEADGLLPASPDPPAGAAPAARDPRLSGLMLVHVEAEAAPARPRLALGQPTTRRWSLARDLRAVREAGLDAIGLWKGKFGEKTRRDVVRAVRGSGVAVSSLSWVGGFTHGDAFDRRQAWYEASEAVKLAGAVGAGCVCVATGGAGGFTQNHAANTLIPGTLQKLAAIAGEFDVQVAVQPLPGRLGKNSVVRTVFETLDLLDRTSRTNVGLVFPTTLMARDPSLVNRVHEFAGAVKLVKLSDCRVAGDGRCDGCGPGEWPGDGSLPLATLVRRLARHGYRGDYELDVWNRRGWRGGDHAAGLKRSATRFAEYFAPEPAAV